MIRKRHVFHIAGFDPAGPEVHYERFERELEIFKRTWNVSATISNVDTRSSALPYVLSASGLNWHVHATQELWPWNDIVREYAERPYHRRLAGAARAFFDLLFSGTFARYIRANFRYGLFSLLPFIQLALFFCFAVLGGHVAASFFILGGASHGLAAVIFCLAFFCFFIAWPARGWRLPQALDDWIFALEYIHNIRPDLPSRLKAFATRLAECSKDASVQEIVVVGHSLGATFAIEVVAEALERFPDFARGRVAICILTVGATIPKFTLHPAAARIRKRLAEIVGDSSICWAEYQSRDDAISFYKFNPESSKKIESDQTSGSPIIRLVQIHDMLRPDTFKLYRNRFLRIHYQSIMANDRPAPYDYFMMICGPVPFAAWTRAPHGFLDFIEPDSGSLLCSMMPR
jgi:pimeloyl-ACP methyl ester carboxylesterase